jgi:hypothetical protein
MNQNKYVGRHIGIIGMTATLIRRGGDLVSSQIPPVVPKKIFGGFTRGEKGRKEGQRLTKRKMVGLFEMTDLSEDRAMLESYLGSRYRVLYCRSSYSERPTAASKVDMHTPYTGNKISAGASSRVLRAP